jgi:PhzF family phenazine biosynthesis protein
VPVPAETARSVDGLPAVLIEAFSERPCAGNGAAVVLLDRPLDDGWLQGLAGSLRQSETAFLLEMQGQWLLRWFTPSCEVPLCGHATLASLLALAHWRRLAPGEELRLLTRSGALEVRLDVGSARRGSIDLPGGVLEPADPPAALQALLQRRQLGQPQGFWTSALGYAVALLDPLAPLASVATLAAELSDELARGLVLMKPQPKVATGDGTPALVAGLPVDYQLRFFAPGLGIDEDPVTGSAHALVASWWQEQLGRSRIVGWQCSDRPGGVVSEALSSGKIRLFGSGHLLWDGTLNTQTPVESDASASASPATAQAGPQAAAYGAWQALLAGG